jgi:hypothetical protein
MKRDKKYYQRLYDITSWQAIHVKHLSYTRNLVLVLSTASLGFTVTLLSDKKLVECTQILWTKTSGWLLFGSIITAILISILESKNYRLKYKIGRMIEYSQDFESLPTEIDRQQQCCTILERVNTALLFVELFMFLTAAAILTFNFF